MKTVKIFFCVLACFYSSSVVTAQKSNKSQSKKYCATSCCQDKAESTGESVTSAQAFAMQAGTIAFENLHEAPLDFILENQQGSMISYDCSDGKKAMAYEIKASAATNNYLIVVQEWWGLNDYIKQEAENYYNALGGKINVLAVDLYDGKVASSPDSARSLVMAAMGSNRKETILSSVITYAGNNANIYTIGWCFGGMMSLQTGIMAGKQGKGTIMYYGQPEQDEAKLKNLQADVLGIFGTQDKSIPNETVDQFASKMKTLGKHFDLVRYDAPHAFANPSNPSYNAAFKEDAFKKSVAFLRERMK
jgi:carboxymethylenebutenolidase